MEPDRGRRTAERLNCNEKVHSLQSHSTPRLRAYENRPGSRGCGRGDLGLRPVVGGSPLVVVVHSSPPASVFFSVGRGLRLLGVLAFRSSRFSGLRRDRRRSVSSNLKYRHFRRFLAHPVKKGTGRSAALFATPRARAPPIGARARPLAGTVLGGEFDWGVRIRTAKAWPIDPFRAESSIPPRGVRKVTTGITGLGGQAFVATSLLILRCRLFLSLRSRIRQALDCSPTDRERELGLDRRETAGTATGAVTVLRKVSFVPLEPAIAGVVVARGGCGRRGPRRWRSSSPCASATSAVVTLNVAASANGPPDLTSATGGILPSPSNYEPPWSVRRGSLVDHLTSGSGCPLDRLDSSSARDDSYLVQRIPTTLRSIETKQPSTDSSSTRDDADLVQRTPCSDILRSYDISFISISPFQQTEGKCVKCVILSKAFVCRSRTPVMRLKRHVRKSRRRPSFAVAGLPVMRITRYVRKSRRIVKCLSSSNAFVYRSRTAVMRLEGECAFVCRSRTPVMRITRHVRKSRRIVKCLSCRTPVMRLSENGYHIQGRQQARKLPTPGTGRPRDRNELHSNPLTRTNRRASLVPAAAVIPAPVAYIKVVAVKKLDSPNSRFVVAFAAPGRRRHRPSLTLVVRAHSRPFSAGVNRLHIRHVCRRVVTWRARLRRCGPTRRFSQSMAASGVHSSSASPSSPKKGGRRVARLALSPRASLPLFYPRGGPSSPLVLHSPRPCSTYLRV
ncbi:unnamed protein product [Acanthosepion pharaonis]|uniref:Uncharacterized protein n=1 Tax=Acanthosepion pharaonis TaxID=158019 RepID=A0A812C9K7_ACAPH|nr:unnamed protein product [Sepia pharaonis]